MRDRRAACLGGQQEPETAGERRSRGQKWLILGNSSLGERVGVPEESKMHGAERLVNQGGGHYVGKKNKDKR